MNIKLMLTGLASFAVMYIPWIYYQKVINPPGDRLLKYQLAGFRPLTPRPALEVIIESYTQVPFTTILHKKLGSLKFHIPPTLQPFGYNALDNRGDEFFHLFALVGIAWKALFWLLKRDSIRDVIKPKNRHPILIFVFSILSASLLLYESVAIHVSPYSNLALLAVLITMVASYSPNVVGYIILAYQIVTFFDKYLRVLPTVFVARTSLVGIVVCAVFALSTFCFIVHITKCEVNSFKADFTKLTGLVHKKPHKAAKRNPQALFVNSHL